MKTNLVAAVAVLIGVVVVSGCKLPTSSGDTPDEEPVSGPAPSSAPADPPTASGGGDEEPGVRRARRHRGRHHGRHHDGRRRGGRGRWQGQPEPPAQPE